MNLDPTLLPLPHPPRSTAHRRHQISGVKLGRRSVRRFQQVAERLHAGDRAPDADAIASTGRVLVRDFQGYHRAPPVSVRMRCLTALRTMAEEPGWTLDQQTREVVSLLSRYDTDVRRLIPDDVPVIGGLDDAILVDMAWPSLHAEVEDYLAFRQARHALAVERGGKDRVSGFDRWQWLRMLEDEALWRHHQREHGLAHYTTPPSPALFRVT